MSEATTESGWSPAAAARAAGDRARSCQHRLQELRLRRPIDSADARRARNHLARAQARAAAAESRRKLRTLGSAARVVAHGNLAAAINTSPSAAAPLAERLEQARISLPALFDRYCALGGACPFFDVDAWVHGLAELPAGEDGILEHALWELTELGDD